MQDFVHQPYDQSLKYLIIGYMDPWGILSLKLAGSAKITGSRNPPNQSRGIYRGFYRDNGKENGNYYRGYKGIV